MLIQYTAPEMNVGSNPPKAVKPSRRTAGNPKLLTKD